MALEGTDVAGREQREFADTPSGLARARRMQELRRLVRTGQHLVVFEIAARRGSFAGAARELGVTQPAVSRYIRELEAALAVELFARHARRVDLTDAGEMLFAGVSAGLTQILRAARRLSHPSPEQVTLVVSPSFALYWLVPRLSELHARHAVDLRIQVCDRHVEVPDDDSTLAVRLGGGTWDGYESRRLMREELLPVASPGRARGLATGDDLASLAGTELVHEEEPHLPSMSWVEFFDAMGVDYDDDGKGIRVTRHELAMQAAIAGQGVALGRTGLIDTMLAQGLLVPVGRRRLRTGRTFHLVWSAWARLSANAELVIEWMVGEAAHGSTPAPRHEYPESAGDEAMTRK